MPGRERLPVCIVPDCVPKLYGNQQYCNKHLVRIRVHGDPNICKPRGFQPGDKNPSKSPERRAELSKRRLGHPLSAETRKKQGESLRKRLATPEMKEKWSRAAKGRKLSEETKIKIRATRAKSTKPQKMSTMLKNADDAFSKYIRAKYADANGYIKCFTCPTIRPIAEMDCGHFVSRQHKSTRWMEENAHPQCWACNRFNEGRKDVYSVRLVEVYGLGILERLQVEKHREFHFNQVVSKEITARFKEKLAALRDFQSVEAKLAEMK